MSKPKLGYSKLDRLWDIQKAKDVITYKWVSKCPYTQTITVKTVTWKLMREGWVIA